MQHLEVSSAVRLFKSLGFKGLSGDITQFENKGTLAIHSAALLLSRKYIFLHIDKEKTAYILTCRHQNA